MDNMCSYSIFTFSNVSENKHNDIYTDLVTSVQFSSVEFVRCERRLTTQTHHRAVTCSAGHCLLYSNT